MKVFVKGETFDTDKADNIRKKIVSGREVTEYVWQSTFAVTVDNKYYPNTWFEHVDEVWIKQKGLK